MQEQPLLLVGATKGYYYTEQARNPKDFLFPRFHEHPLSIGDFKDVFDCYLEYLQGEAYEVHRRMLARGIECPLPIDKHLDDPSITEDKKDFGDVEGSNIRENGFCIGILMYFIINEDSLKSELFEAGKQMELFLEYTVNESTEE